MRSYARRVTPARDPNKSWLELIGKPLGIVATAIAILGGGFALYERSTKPLLDAELLIPYTGWEVSLRNSGSSLAKQVRVGVVVWRNIGVPAADVRRSYELNDLAPGASASVRIEVIADWDDAEYRVQNARSSRSGYFVVTCEGCKVPRAWAFHIPGDEDREIETAFFPGRGGAWPIAEFRFPERAPFLNDCVNYPQGVCGRPRERLWTPSSGSSRRDGFLPLPPAPEAREGGESPAPEDDSVRKDAAYKGTVAVQGLGAESPGPKGGNVRKEAADEDTVAVPPDAVAEAIAVLEDRAALINRGFENLISILNQSLFSGDGAPSGPQEPGSTDVNRGLEALDRVQKEFNDLHAQHIAALRAGQYLRANDLHAEIVRLLLAEYKDTFKHLSQSELRVFCKDGLGSVRVSGKSLSVPKLWTIYPEPEMWAGRATKGKGRAPARLTRPVERSRAARRSPAEPLAGKNDRSR